MKAVVCTRYGPPEVLELREVARPAPKADQVCIRIAATGVTASDCIVRAGFKLRPPLRYVARLAFGLRAPRQHILGFVLAGHVDSVGRNITSFKPGDRVFGMDRHFGAYAEYVCWPRDAILGVAPANLDDRAAAAVPYGGLLALHFLRRAKVRKGQRVLVYGASGAIGTSAVQLARHLGADVTGVCSGANVELVRSLGASEVIDYTQEGFKLRGEGYDLIFDAVGRRKSATALARHRHLSVDDGLPLPARDDLSRLKELVESGSFRPVIDRTYSLDEMVEAHRYVDAGHKKGNVAVSV
jgi:NADPH:quinone reductase-like Zn-dependent oxidoreductase